ncbi:MAG: hypothetical protein IPL40_16280 [Proteobacteria bacterium]|nr:hypothetical protein [Pseudomonadota bacterium]
MTMDAEAPAARVRGRAATKRGSPREAAPERGGVGWRGLWGRCWPLLLPLALPVILACGGNRRALFAESLEAYQHALRWGDVGGLTSYLGQQARQRLLARGAAWRELRVVEATVMRVDWLGSSAARAVVQLEWYPLRSGSLGVTLLSQRWADGAGGWQLTEQRVIGGVPLPVLTLP